MTELKPDDLVVRIPDVVLALDATGMVRAAAPDGQGAVLLGPAGLDLLRDLTRPRRVDGLLQAAAGVQAFMDRSAALVQLQRAGLVHRPGQRVAPSRAPFDAQEEHARMLFDAARTHAFLAAVRAAVRPGDVVLDIGTGTGVLATAAALAGARHVYAVEAGSVADVAQAVIDGNGVSDRVTVVRGWSTEVDLPERADLLVSETIGSDPLGERMLEVFRDAQQRHLRRGARCVPQSLDLHVTAVQVPDDWPGAFLPGQVAAWSADYGIDLTPLLLWQGRQGMQLVPVEEVRTWPGMSTTARIARVDLRKVDSLRVDASASLEMHATGRVDGLALHFSADLGSSLLSTEPAATGWSSWRTAVTPVRGVQVTAGSALRVRYRYRAEGPDGLVVEDMLAQSGPEL